MPVNNGSAGRLASVTSPASKSVQAVFRDRAGNVASLTQTVIWPGGFSPNVDYTVDIGWKRGQYRTLVVLASRGSQPLGYLAEQLDVSPSTATRMCDRLVRKGLVERRPSESSRREIEVRITREGREIVDRVTRRRRKEIATILRAVPEQHRSRLVEALNAFAGAAGEVPEQAWSLGWSA